MPTTKFNPEGGWEPATPMKPPRHWPWLQRIVDWIWQKKK
jgi:hypothetical protein